MHIAVVVLLALLLATIFLVTQREPRLLDHATRVGDPTFPVWGRLGCEWLSSHELLIQSGTWQHSIYLRHDLRTGQDLKLTTFTQLNYQFHDWKEEASSDGRWYLAVRGGDNTGDAVDAASLLDDRRLSWSWSGKKCPIKWPYHADSIPFVEARWMPDGRRWAEFLCTDAAGGDAFASPLEASRCPYVLTGDITAPTRVRAVRVAPSSPLNMLAREFRLMRNYGRLVLLPEDRVLLCLTNGFDSEGVRIDMTLTDLYKNDRPLRKVSYTLPDGEILEDMEIAPSGEYIAWRFRRDTVSPVARLLHRIWPAYSEKPRSRTSLWVSRPDGTAFRELGYVDTPYVGPRAITAENMDLGSLQWLPGGKELSFKLDNALWTLRVAAGGEDAGRPH